MDTRARWARRTNGNVSERKRTDPKVLVVDDEENLVALVAMILGKEGYTVKTALNCDQALEHLHQIPFDLAILDIKMFPIDGIVFLGEIKKRSPSTKVIMVTAYPTADSRTECFNRGASFYFSKPLNLQQLKSTIRTLLAD
jgi:DNA-binding response OmpR family regulator